MLAPILSFVLTALCALIGMAFYTLLEQKVLSYHQSRKGPNKVSIAGIPQPFADAIKLFTKETSAPTLSNTSPFIAAPMGGLILALMLWMLLPSHNQVYFMTLSTILFLAVSSLSVYTTMAAGWSSNSKYALLGALRSIAQTISYEVSMALLLMSALIVLCSMSMFKILTMPMLPTACILLPITATWFCTTLAETNRAPFDFAEGESELVSGFNTEYSAGKFALIFMAEYASILIMCTVTAVFFLQNPVSPIPLVGATMLLSTAFLSVRAAYPRLRYDLLMYLTWKTLLPFSLAMLTLILPMMNLMPHP